MRSLYLSAMARNGPFCPPNPATALAQMRQVIVVELEGHRHATTLDRPLSYEPYIAVAPNPENWSVFVDKVQTLLVGPSTSL
jgi:hypothetical protein